MLGSLLKHQNINENRKKRKGGIGEILARGRGKKMMRGKTAEEGKKIEDRGGGEED